MSEEIIVLIDLDDLAVDDVNMRAGQWDKDEELISSVKEQGIRHPLIVRPAAPDTGVKYAIIAGSRRFHAAIEAGLDEVPCIVRTFEDDLSAMAESFIENVHKKDVPGWVKAGQIGRMADKINDNASETEKIKILMTKTGLKDPSVREFLAIVEEPIIMELMKEPAERSAEATELLKRFSIAGTGRTLNIRKASIIARELKGYSKERIIEVAAYVLDKPIETTRELVKKAKEYPKLSMVEVHQKVMSIPKGWRAMFEFASHLSHALDEAATRVNLDKKSLVVRYVERGLKEDGYI